MLSSGLLREAKKECGKHIQRKGNSELPPEMREPHSNEGKDEWDAEMQEWIELYRRDVLALDDGEHHIISISKATHTSTCTICQPKYQAL